MTTVEWTNGNDSGPHQAPVTKLLLHTTEGSTIESACAAYASSNSWPHWTVDSHQDRICKHLGFDVAARALKNPKGGVETNTAGVIQIEIVGTATNPAGINWEWIGSKVVGPICAELSIPVKSTVTWVAYPASYGESAAQRLQGNAWLNYRGILGHQHAAENSHGDPGAIPIQTVLAAAQPPKPPSQSQPSERVGMLFVDVNSGAQYLGGPGYWKYINDPIASEVLTRVTAYGPPIQVNGPQVEAVKKQFLEGQTADDVPPPA